MLATPETTPPVYATPLTPGRPNLWKQIVMVAQLLGLWPLLYWQANFLKLATEYEQGNPQDGIVPYWREVVLSVPRHCGKTDCVFCILHVLRFMGFYRRTPGRAPLMGYHAQSARDAQEVWRDKIVPRVVDTKWAKQVGYRFVAGASPKVHTGGRGAKPGSDVCYIIANKADAGRGYSTDMLWMDEARAEPDFRRESDLLPGQSTSASKQLFVVSTMGDHESCYHNAKVDLGRETATLQMNGDNVARRLAYYEHGIGDMASGEYDASDPCDLASRPSEPRTFQLVAPRYV